MRAILAGALLLSLTTAVSWAAIPDDGFNLMDSVIVSLTPRGQAAIQNQIFEMLSNKDLHLLERDLPDFKYRADSPINLEKLPPGYEQFSKAVRQVRQAIKKWIVGFRLNDPQPLVEAAGISYQVGLEDFQLQADYEIEKTGSSRPSEKSVLMRLKVKIPNFKFKISRLRAKDLNNPILGVIGANALWLGLADSSEALSVEIPVRIGVKDDGRFQVEVLQVLTNIARLKMTSGFDAPLVLPKIQVRIGNQVSTLSLDKVRKLVESKQPQMAAALVRYFDDFAQTKLPAQMNLLLKLAVAKGFEFSGEMRAAGENPLGTPGAKIKYFMRPQDLSMRDGFLDLSFVGKLHDPQATREYFGFNPADHRPYLTHAPERYDFALAISINYINRFVRLGFDRGNFANMPNDDGTYLHFDESPRFMADDGRLKYMDLKIDLKMDPVGIAQNLVLTTPYRVQLEATSRVRVADGSVQLVMDELNESWVHIADQYIKENSDVVRNIVRFEALKVLKSKNLKYHMLKGLMLADKLPIPPQIMGIPLEIEDVQIDPAGFIVTYVNFVRP